MNSSYYCQNRNNPMEPPYNAKNCQNFGAVATLSTNNLSIKDTNIDTLINMGNSYLLQDNYDLALDYYNRVFQYEQNHPVALLNMVLTLSIMKDKTLLNMNYSLSSYLEILNELDQASKDIILHYIVNDLYYDTIFDKVITSMSCIDFLCCYSYFDDAIISLIFNYYKSIDLTKVSVQKSLLLERDLCNFCVYLKKKNVKNLKEYAKDLLHYSKDELFQGKFLIFPFFHAQIILYDNNDSQFYYYLSLLNLCLKYNSNSYFDNLLLSEQKNICKIRNSLMDYRKVLLPFILHLVGDTSFIKNSKNEIELKAQLNSHINVIYFVLEFINCFYIGMEKEYFQLIYLLTFYIHKKICGYGEDNQKNLLTYCSDKTEFLYLKSFYNDYLCDLGRVDKIRKRQKFICSQNNDTNKILIPYLSEGIDNTLSYAKMTLALAN